MAAARGDGGLQLLGCVEYETNPRIKAIWERFLDYELGQLHFVVDLFKQVERRDPAEVLPAELPEPIEYGSHREFVRETLAAEVDLRAIGTEFVGERRRAPEVARLPRADERRGSPSETVAAGYRWAPGTELTTSVTAKGQGA